MGRKGFKSVWTANRIGGAAYLHAVYVFGLGRKGITAFLVGAGSPGLHVGPPLQKLGIKASSTCPVHFDDVEVSEDCILGEVGEGYKVAMSLLNEGRIGAASRLNRNITVVPVTETPLQALSSAGELCSRIQCRDP
ncbi:unnamed protein product [Rangifer tarandus platyrhynchus]|uniref:Uncharacterized protein n=1 Tax=Rangifer tarandus platyrhynchus TaxID=3082113 RepID=A0ABN8XIW6_RANTA|nr:unnamed protein product [Rangifer tarandus platyrhynchus]